MNRPRVSIALAIAGTLLVSACSAREPRAIVIGEDVCAYCRMQISDARFGGEAITRKGKIQTFDSVECLASWYLAIDDTSAVRTLLVSDYRRPGTLVPVAQARFVRGRPGTSPMGQGWIATASAEEAAGLSPTAGDAVLGWSGILADARARRDRADQAASEYRRHAAAGAGQ